MSHKDERHYTKLDNLLKLRKNYIYGLNGIEDEVPDSYYNNIDAYVTMLEQLIYASCGSDKMTLAQYELHPRDYVPVEHYTRDGLVQRLWQLSELHVPIRQYLNIAFDYKGFMDADTDVLQNILKLVYEKFEDLL